MYFDYAKFQGPHVCRVLAWIPTRWDSRIWRSSWRRLSEPHTLHGLIAKSRSSAIAKHPRSSHLPNPQPGLVGFRRTLIPMLEPDIPNSPSLCKEAGDAPAGGYPAAAKELRAALEWGLGVVICGKPDCRGRISHPIEIWLKFPLG